MLRFLNRWGLWREPAAPVQGVTGYQWIRDLVPVAEIWETQERWRKAILGPVGEWLADSPPSAFQPRAVYPHFNLQATCCATAIRHSITLDLLRDVKFKICKRKDCRAPYAIESEHERTFCSQYCGHLESLRKNRRDAKKARERENAKKAKSS